MTVSVREDRPQMDVCVCTDVGTAPRIRNVTVEVFQDAVSRVKTSLELDERGCQTLWLRDLEGDALIRVDYPGDAWSAHVVSETNVRLVMEKEAPAEEDEMEQDSQTMEKRQYRYRYLWGALMVFLWIALGYRYRKQVVRLLKRLGILKTPVPALPKEISQQVALKAHLPSARQQEDHATGDKGESQKEEVKPQRPLPEATAAALRAHIAACFSAVVKSTGEEEGWGTITPTAFAQEYCEQLSERDAQILHIFCHDVEKYAFDPASVMTEKEVLDIHQMAERLTRRLA